MLVKTPPGVVGMPSHRNACHNSCCGLYGKFHKCFSFTAAVIVINKYNLFVSAGGNDARRVRLEERPSVTGNTGTRTRNTGVIAAQRTAASTHAQMISLPTAFGRDCGLFEKAD